MHLLILYPDYRHVIAKGAGGPVRFPWGDATVWVTDGALLRVLIHDDSGATKATVGIERPGPDGLWVNTYHLVGSFFIEETYSR